MRKFLIAAGIFIAGILLIAAIQISIMNQRAGKLIDKCMTLKLGDSKDIVISTLGEPMATHEYSVQERKITVLRYKVPVWFDTFPQVDLNEKGLAEWIVCDDSYSQGKSPIKSQLEKAGTR